METLDPISLATTEPAPTLAPLNGLATSVDIIEKQNPPQTTPKPQMETLGPRKTGKTLLDLGVAIGLPRNLALLIDDMQEAVLGIIGDITSPKSERRSVSAILTHENRLRGLGVLLILVSMVGLFLEALVGNSL